MQLRIILIKDNPVRSELLKASLHRSGYSSVTETGIDSNLLKSVEMHNPDLMVIDSDSLKITVLDQLKLLSEHKPLPVVVFTEDDNRDMIRKAVSAGVTAYIVDGLDQHRLGSIIEVAMARFHETGRLRQELADTRTSLAERKNIERAKGILMKQRNVDESEAYHALRKLAMDKNLRIGQVAENVISVAELLN